MKLTPRQQEILEYIRTHSRIVTPSVREIAKHFRLCHTTIQDHIEALRKKGALPSKSA